MNIRIARPEDSIAIAEITAEGLGYDCVPEIIAQNIAALDSSHARLFVAEVDGEVVGFVDPQVYEAVYFFAPCQYSRPCCPGISPRDRNRKSPDGSCRGLGKGDRRQGRSIEFRHQPNRSSRILSSYWLHIGKTADSVFEGILKGS